MKLRPGDQPLPEKNDLPFVQDAVIADIEARKLVGIERYGTPLQAFNGRDALRDAYEEAIDLAMYLKQAILERDEHAFIAGVDPANAGAQVAYCTVHKSFACQDAG